MKNRNVTYLRLVDKACRHSALWEVLEATLRGQREHNMEMQDRYRDGHTYERALMQQQFANGVGFALSIMQQLRDLHKPKDSAMFLNHVKKWRGVSGCRLSPLVKKQLQKLMESPRAKILQKR